MFSGFHILVISSSPKKAVVGHCQSIKIRLGPNFYRCNLKNIIRPIAPGMLFSAIWLDLVLT